MALLKDSFWNVRVAACNTLGAIVTNPPDYVLEALVKCLKEGSINRTVVCGTLCRMGPQGVSILVEMLQLKGVDHKLKAAILPCLEEVEMGQPSLDLTVKELFRLAREKQPELKLSALKVLGCLQHRN